VNRKERAGILDRLRELTADDPVVMAEAQAMSDANLWAYFKGFIKNSGQQPTPESREGSQTGSFGDGLWD
jgi:hypothetical protein